MKRTDADATSGSSYSQIYSIFNQHSQTAYTILFSIICLIATHSYRWMHATSASHDSLMLVQTDGAWMVSLGRFLTPIYVSLRGEIVSPWTCGLIGSCFIVLSVLLCVKLLDIRHPISIAALSVALCTNATLTLTNATYICWFDVYALALFLATSASFICMRWKYGFFAAAVLIAASLGFYQAYIQVFLSLAIASFALSLARGDEILPTTVICLKSLAAAIIGGAIYYFAMKASMEILGIAASESYNGISGAVDFTNNQITDLMLNTFMMPVMYLWRPETHAIHLSGWLNLISAVSTVLAIAYCCAQQKKPILRFSLCVILFLLMPFAANCVYVASKGLMHALMIYSYFLFYALVIATLDLTSRIIHKNKEFTSSKVMAFGAISSQNESHIRHILRAAPRAITFALGSVMLTSNLIYAGQVYLLKDIESEATLSAMTRVIDRFEQMDGYIPGKTQVVLIGNLNDSSIAADKSDFLPDYFRKSSASDSWLPRGTGLNAKYTVTYLATYKTYMNNILGYSVLLADEATTASFNQLPEVTNLPSFPAKDCCAWVNGSVVVKLSEK